MSLKWKEIWCSSTRTVMSPLVRSRTRSTSGTARTGRRKGLNSYGCFVGIILSARRNESVATKTNLFPSGYTYTLPSSCFTVDNDALYHTDFIPFRKSPSLKRSGLVVMVGRVGKSSGETVVMSVSLVGVLREKVLPFTSKETEVL